MNIPRKIILTVLGILICAGLPAQIDAQTNAHDAPQSDEQAQAAAQPETSVRELANLEEIAEYALTHNLSHRKDLWEAEKSRNDIKSLLRLDQSSFTFTQEQPLTDPGAGNQDLEFSAGADIPVLDQFSISASLNQDNEINSGLNFMPLAHSDSNEQAVISYEKAVVEAGQSAVEAGKEASTAALTWMDLSRQLNTQEAQVSLRETAYGDEKTRYDMGESTLDDVKEALLEWSEAQSEMASLQQKTRAAQADLYSILHADTSELTVAVLTLTALRKNLEVLKANIDVDQAAPETAATVLLADLEARILEEKLKHTWLFEPELKASLSLYQAADQNPQFSATVSLSFGLDDFNRAERGELTVDIELARENHLQTIEQSIRDYEEQLLTLEAAQNTREIRKIELEQTALLWEEAKFLRAQGDVSELELDEARIAYEQAENSLFSILVEEYTEWLNIKSYITQEL